MMVEAMHLVWSGHDHLTIPAGVGEMMDSLLTQGGRPPTNEGVSRVALARDLRDIT